MAFNQLKYFNQIRESYKNWKPRSDPYGYFNWFNVFTPIEYNVWCDIRYWCIPFYPQYPVDKYFIDFADPIKKIGIEVDGKEYHQNFEKDFKRQQEIENLGWEIYRINGRDTYGNEHSFSLSERIIIKIRENYF